MTSDQDFTPTPTLGDADEPIICTDRVWLVVPYHEKDLAKAEGARDSTLIASGGTRQEARIFES
jgi:hypothetical protein